MKFIEFNKVSETQKINLLNLNHEELRQFFLSIGEKLFCADQVMSWIYQRYCTHFMHMTNISLNLKKN